MAIGPVSATPPTQTAAAFGLDFPSLLKIILAQLTYQDPLKPVDNAQFVSQLAQFSQLQQSQALNDQITNMLAGQAASQATGLIGREIDLLGGPVPITGTVTGVSFTSGQPLLTIETADHNTIANISIADVSQVRVAKED